MPFIEWSALRSSGRTHWRSASTTEASNELIFGLCWEVFAPLQNLEIFNAVELDATFGTLQRPNGADFDPETLHDWPKYRDELVAMARGWATTSNSRSSPK